MTACLNFSSRSKRRMLKMRPRAFPEDLQRASTSAMKPR